MLSPDYLETLPDAALELWSQVEEDILSDMARRLSKMDGITDTALWQVKRLEQIRLFRTGIARELARASGQSESLIARLMVEAGTQALLEDDAIHDAAGRNVTSPNNSPALKNLLNAGAKQTNGTMANLTATTANTATGQFERALDRAWLQTASGAFDYQTAVRRCISDLAAAGLEAVRYPSGHTDTLEVAVRRAVVTGINQSACKLQIQRCRELGCDLVEVTAHAGARPEHASWQGKIYSISGEHPKYPPLTETGYGSGAGLGGWNCRHSAYPFWEGISEPQYTPERLARLNAREVGYKGRRYTRYEINQMQRARERRVRRWKRQYAMEEAAGLDSTQTAARLKAAREDLKQFAYDTGGRVDSARVSVHGFGRSQAAKAAWDKRRADANASERQFRRTKNIGAFAQLEEVMELKHVRSVAADMGLELDGAKLQIVRDEALLEQDYFGYTFPDGSRIQLYPKAFQTREQLVRTLGHEYIHLRQVRENGIVKTAEELFEREREAYASEEGWWSRYVKKTGYRH
ncbi:MAG: phage minor capsid protein [Candidatus Onthomonas sp.]